MSDFNPKSPLNEQLLFSGSWYVPRKIMQACSPSQLRAVGAEPTPKSLIFIVYNYAHNIKAIFITSVINLSQCLDGWKKITMISLSWSSIKQPRHFIIHSPFKIRPSSLLPSFQNVNFFLPKHSLVEVIQYLVLACCEVY